MCVYLVLIKKKLFHAYKRFWCAECVVWKPFFMYTLYTIKTWIPIRTRSRPKHPHHKYRKNECFLFSLHILNNIWPSVSWHFLHALNKALSLCVTQLCLQDIFSLIMRFFSVLFSTNIKKKKKRTKEKTKKSRDG